MIKKNKKSQNKLQNLSILRFEKQLFNLLQRIILTLKMSYFHF